MTSDRYAQLCELLNELRKLEGAERERFMAQRCTDDASLHADLVKLLDADDLARRERFLSEPCLPAAQATLTEFEPSDPLIGRRLGSYLIERRIGGGGMGTV
jgi:hypothetical protein